MRTTRLRHETGRASSKVIIAEPWAEEVTREKPSRLPAQCSIDETPLERAILDLLADRREVYPSHLVGALRKQDATLPLHHTRHVLERLFCERRVARLWHRYMLPRDVGRVRGEWLAMIDRQSSRLISDLDDQGATSVARHVLASWDGWSLDASSRSVAG